MPVSASCARSVRSPWSGRAWRVVAVLPWVLMLLSGCAADSWKLPTLWKKTDPEIEGPKDSLVLKGGKLEKDRTLDAEGQKDLEAARRLFQEKDYAKAEPLFHKLQKNKKVPDAVAEESLFFEAEAQRLQKHYRDAEPTYKLLLDRFRNTQYTDRVTRSLFEIAEYWLNDTRAQMTAYYEQLEGKRWFVMPASYVHIDKDKPILDTEGRAVQVLDTIRLHDINGPLGEKALFYLATVKFYRAEYREADFYFSQLFQQYPNSGFAAKAIKQSVICKQLSVGGPSYDRRPIEEAKKLLQNSQNAYPELSKEEGWIQKQLIGMNLQQADGDFRVAEFYRRIGHPGPAYFYYELVRRRYPNTNYEKRALERMNELRSQVEREQAATAATKDAPPASTSTAPEQGPAPRQLPAGFAPGSNPRP
jgi:outer membrane protein assembly factor BamD (BamD/ComL family)